MPLLYNDSLEYHEVPSVLHIKVLEDIFYENPENKVKVRLVSGTEMKVPRIKTIGRIELYNGMHFLVPRIDWECLDTFYPPEDYDEQGCSEHPVFDSIEGAVLGAVTLLLQHATNFDDCDGEIEGYEYAKMLYKSKGIEFVESEED